MRVGGIAEFGDQNGHIGCLLFAREIARVVHRGRTSGAPVAGHIHREDIESRLRQKPVQAWLSGNDLKIATLDQNEKELGKWRKS